MKPKLSSDDLTEIEIKVLQNIGIGFSNAILLKTLCQRTGILDERKVRLAIEELRKKLWPILSGDTGYFICNTQEELDRFIAYHRKEVIARCIMMRNIKKGCAQRLGKAVQVPMI